METRWQQDKSTTVKLQPHTKMQQMQQNKTVLSDAETAEKKAADVFSVGSSGWDESDREQL